jgi:chemotaxis-related protein WspD
VHAAAALQLLDSTLPPGYQAEWTGHFAQELEEKNARTRSVVIFRLGREWLALPTAIFKEVAPVRPVHSLPHRRGGVISGVVNVRGELLVCVALDKVLGVEPLPAADPDHSQSTPRLLVVSHRGNRLVFPVEAVHGVHEFAPDELQEVPASVARGSVAYTAAILPWREQTVGCLNEEKLFQTLNRSLA